MFLNDTYNINHQPFGDLTTGQVKEYFDVGVYRNILDMLNTFDGSLNLFGSSLYNSLNSVEKTLYPWTSSNTKAVIGYAVIKVGKHGKKSRNSPRVLVDKTISVNALKKGVINRDSIFDLLNLARQLNWELNRVRLPAPHNFRQIADKIQGRVYTPIYIKTCVKEPDTGMTECNNVYNPNNFINAIELASVYKQLKTTITIIRNSVRKEIDAANLAKKVQEETLRAEKEELISREQAASEAEVRRLKILEEKKLALEQEFLDAEALKIKLRDTRAELEAELLNIETLKQVASEPELIELVEQETQVIKAIDKVETVVIDKQASLETAKVAAINLNIEIKEAAKQQDIVSANTVEKKTNLTPIIITALTGLLFL